jgi:PPOX class probable F420-dependent enzyme
MATVFPDPATPFGERVARKLRDDMVIWLTTVGADGTPQPNPVWFLAEGDTLLIYSQPTAHKLRHIADNPRVSLNFVGDGQGGDVVVMTGTAEVASGQPLPHQVPAYMEKYGAAVETIEDDIDSYNVGLRVRIDKVRGF